MTVRYPKKKEITHDYNMYLEIVYILWCDS